MAAKFLPRIAVATVVMRVVIGLKQAVLLHYPRSLRPRIGANDARGDFRVVVRRHIIAHIVDERGDDEFVIGSVAQRTGRRLQGVTQPGNAVSLQRLIEFAQRRQKTVRQCLHVFALRAVQEFIVLARALLHPAKTHHCGGGGIMYGDFFCHLAVFTRVQVRVRIRSVAALASAARYSLASISGVGYSVASLRIMGLTSEREAMLSLP